MAEPELLIGTAGWSYPDWAGVVYPGGERDKLGFLARYLNCIEINSTFYRPPSARSSERWVERVSHNPDFRFTAKLWQRFTHETSKPYSRTDVETFRAGLTPLKESGRLAGLLLQFPFTFRDAPSSRDLLRRLSEDFREFPRVLEVRDASWSEPDAVEYISGLGLNLACLDMPMTKSSFREWARVTGDLGYLRLHGRNRAAWFSKEAGRDDRYNYLYSKDELDRIVSRVGDLQNLAKRLVVIWNNHFRGKAAVNAFQTLQRLLKRKVSVPPLLVEAYPELESVARPEGDKLF